MDKKERPGFEEALNRLETIIEKLENKDITLEKSVELYEEGLKLSAVCSEILENASLKLEQVGGEKNESNS